MNIDNYSNLKRIHIGSISSIYKAKRNSDNIDVILKILNKDFPTLEEIAKFKFEYHVQKQLDIEGIPKVFAFETFKNSYLISMEFVSGKSLKEVLETGVFSVDEFLNTSIKIIELVAKIHEKQIIHKNLTPTNIIWDNEDNTVNIIYFGFSSFLQNESTKEIEIKLLEGTLVYMSPEQTGRMNRKIDYRSDYYILGCLFYKMLTGKEPFESNDPLKLIHCHIAKKATPPSKINDLIPDSISKIIMKLLSKNSEDRYQSSFGIKHDLNICLENIEKIHSFKFDIGSNDIFEGFEISQKLYGRDKELNELLNIYHNMKTTSESKFAIVKGHLGIGKTSLIKELNKYIENSYFVSGKSTELSKNTRYLPFIEAFNQFVNEILKESDLEISKWRKKILASVGLQGQVIIDVIPKLELIIGKQPQVPEFTTNEEFKRFTNVFQKFIKVLSSKEKPLIICIDNFNCSDLGSQKILQLMLEDEEIHNVYIICCFRDNELDENDSLNIVLKNISKFKNVNEINLLPLTLNNVNSMISDTLRCSEQECEELSNLCCSKTEGNPFFLVQFLKTLFEEKLLTFNTNVGIWEWDMLKINNKGYTDNIIEFEMKRIAKIPGPIFEVLKSASCFGNYFDLRSLSIINEKSMVEISKYLVKAIENRIIIPLDNNYIYVETLSDDENFNSIYKFSHYSIQQILGEMLNETKKKLLHLKIGRLYLKTYSLNKFDEYVFDIVNHLNKSVDLIDDDYEKNNLCECNYHAGMKAKKSAAYENSLEYFKFALGILKNLGDWDYNCSLIDKIHVKTSMVAYILGKYDYMDKLINEVLNNSQNPLAKINVHEIKMLASISQDDRVSAVNKNFDVLKIIDFNIPKKPSKFYLFKNNFKIKVLLKLYTHEKFLNTVEMSDILLLNICRILSKSGVSAYYTNFDLFILLSDTLILLSLKNGFSKHSLFGFFGYAVKLFRDNKIKKGLEVSNLIDLLYSKYESIENKCQYLFYYGSFLGHYKINFNDLRKMFIDSYLIGIETGDFEYSSHSLYQCTKIDYCKGKNLIEFEKELKNTTIFLKKSKQKSIILSNNIYYQTVLNLLGRSKSPTILSGEMVNNEKELLDYCVKTNNSPLICIMKFNKMHLCYLFYDYINAKKVSIEVNNYIDGQASSLTIPTYIYYESLIYINNNNYKKPSRKLIAKIKKNQKLLKERSFYLKTAYLHKYYLVEAEWARTWSNEKKAMDYYDLAIKNAKEYGYKQEEALSNERAALFYFSINKNEIAYLYLQKARICYKNWGAIAKVNHLDSIYDKSKLLINADIISNNKTKNFSLNAANRFLSSSIEILSIIKNSETIIEERDYNILLSKIIKIIAENSGAEKIALFYKGEKDLEFETGYNLSCQIDFPDAILNFVEKTQESLLLNNAMESEYKTDDYISKFGVKSLFCIPLIYQNNLNRILYIENNLSTNVFTDDKIQLLKIFSSQMVISLENAQLYQRLEDLVQKRTAKLNYQNKRILDGINYAKLIQKSILPLNETLSKDIPCYFIIWKPRDVVGGDIYWYSKVNDNYLVAVIDCTGHGVPGAFMTMTANTSLNNIIKTNCNDNPAEILKELNKNIRFILNQSIKKEMSTKVSDSELFMLTDDGLDIGLCYVKPKEKQIIYSGAKMPLCICNNEEITIIKGDKQGIGYKKSREDFTYTNHTINISEEDVFYLSSDGYTDQIGNDQKTIFSKKRFLSTLTQISKNPMDNQRDVLMEILNNHKGKTLQTDDITIFAFKP